MKSLIHKILLENESYDLLRTYNRIVNKRRLLSNSKIIAYRGLRGEEFSGFNFNDSNKYIYFALTKEYADTYGDVNEFIINDKEENINIFVMNNKNNMEVFGEYSVFRENTDVVNKLIELGYDGLLYRAVELMLFNSKYVNHIK